MTPLQMILAGLTDWVTENGTDPYNVEYVIEPMTTAIHNALNCEPESSPRAEMSAQVLRIMVRAGIPS